MTPVMPLFGRSLLISKQWLTLSKALETFRYTAMVLCCLTMNNHYQEIHYLDLKWFFFIYIKYPKTYFISTIISILSTINNNYYPKILSTKSILAGYIETFCFSLKNCSRSKLFFYGPRLHVTPLNISIVLIPM